MIKLFLIVLIFSCVTSCENNEQPADDYVLIEFASKLEEDFERIDSTHKN